MFDARPQDILKLQKGFQKLPNVGVWEDHDKFSTNSASNLGPSWKQRVRHSKLSVSMAENIINSILVILMTPEDNICTVKSNK